MVENLDISPYQTKSLTVLLKRYNLLAVYLFGSRTDGTAHKDSDYDFAILFKTKPTFEMTSLIPMELEKELSSILNNEVDIIVLNNLPLEQKFMIISRGKMIYTSEDNIRTDFEDITIRDYLDYKPFLELYKKEVREDIKEGDFYVKL